MRIILLLAILFSVSLLSKGQNANIDKLKKELDGHPTQDAYRVDRLNKIVMISNSILPNDERMKMVNEALNISYSIKYPVGEGYAMLNITSAGRGTYSKEQRNRFLQQADSIAKKTGDPELQAYVLLRIGDEKRFTIESEQVLSYYLKAEEIAARTRNKELLAACQGYLAEYYEISRTDHATALQYALKAIDNSEQTNSLELLALNYKTLAAIYRSLGEDDKTAIYYKKALEATEKLGSRRQEANLHTSIGIWHYNKLKYHEAIKEYNQSLEIATKNNFDAADIAVYEGNLAAACLATDSLALGITHASHALMLFGQSNRIEDMCWCNDLLASAYLKKKMADSSIFYADAGLQISRKTGTLEYISGNLGSLAGAYALKKDFEKAYKYHVEYLTYKDSMMSTDISKKAASLEYKYNLEKKQAQISALNKDKQIQRNILISALIVLLLIIITVFMLIRNNRHKQKANRLLLKQKQLIEEQRDQTNKALAELQQTQKQLIQSEKMASLGELTAGIAHEIQNPLNFVNNFSEVNSELIAEMKDELSKGKIDVAKTIADDINDNEQKINFHGKRADAIVKGMLQHSRGSSGVKELTDINALADEYLRLAYHGLQAKDKDFNATMKTDYDKSIGNINIIPQDIGRVILNLITNAFYAVTEKKKQQPENYEPLVTVSTRKLGSPPVGGDGGSKVEVRVKDDGNGIPQKVLDKIFQPFFTTKPTGQGTGLGLSLAYDIVKAHGGEIKVETQEGEGTAFTIILPFSN